MSPPSQGSLGLPGDMFIALRGCSHQGSWIAGLGKHFVVPTTHLASRLLSPGSCGTLKTVSKTPQLPDFTGLIPAVVLGLVLRKQVFPPDTPMFLDTSISPETSQDLPAARLLVVSWGVLGVLFPQHPRDHSKHQGGHRHRVLPFPGANEEQTVCSVA